MKKILCFITAVILCAFVSINTVDAAEAFVIENYEVVADVYEDNTIRLTQNITMNFSDSRHGIILSVPYISEITRVVDGVDHTDRIKIKITDINAVSYTHLDVYKRQAIRSCLLIL